MNFFNTRLDDAAALYWSKVDLSYKKAFFLVMVINLLAFGFEMTNLTLNHDDVIQIFTQDALLGYSLGRFGFGWMHYYFQNSYIMPFLQLVEGVILMSVYGLLIARLWGLRSTLDLALIAAIVCVFPYMANLYQYNASVVPFSMAHLLVATAVVLSLRGTFFASATATLLYVAAFSIYQSVIANAATIIIFWLLSKFLLRQEGQAFISGSTTRSTIVAVVSVIAGGILYVAAVFIMGIRLDSYQSADKAFSFSGGLNLSYAIPEILKGTRSFFFWPEYYFPNYLKKFQLLFIATSAIFCLWLPKEFWGKLASITLLVLAGFSPRVLQLVHPEGHYHSLTLTAYAVVIAGAVMIIHRAGNTLARNASVILVLFLISGYVLQCNWISTVNYLNMLAHYSTLTQILARVRSLPDTQWDGKTIAVVGRYEMRSDYPFKAATGVATKFIDVEHMDKLARLMRDEAQFVSADQTMPKVLEYAATHLPWPHPASVGIVDGKGVVVLSKD